MVRSKTVRGSFLTLGLSIFSSMLHAQETTSHPEQNAHAAISVGESVKRKWSMDLGSGGLFSNVRDSKLDRYTLVPVELSLARSFDRVYLEHFRGGILQGSPEVFLKGHGTVVQDGVESHLAGFNLGARYNFTKPDWPAIPFAEATVGLAWADARPTAVNGRQHGLGERFNFNFTVAAGLRYDVSDHWFVRLEGVYSHYSNGGLSEPQYKNKAIDAVGPVLSIGFRF